MPDDEGSSDKQAEYMKSRKKNVLSLICCIATIAIVFTILGIIIANTSRTGRRGTESISFSIDVYRFSKKE